MVVATSGVTPRQELALAVVQGEMQIAGLIGSKILGQLPITWKNAHLVKATIADSLGNRDISADKYIHAPGANFPRLTATFGEATLTVTPRGVELAVPQETVLSYRDRFDVLGFFAARFGKEIWGLTKERLIAAQIFNSGTFTATNSAVAYTVANLSTISLVPDVINLTRRLKAVFEMPPYVMVSSGPVYERVRQAATVQAYTAGTLKAGQEATKDMILSGFREYGIVDWLVGDAYYNSAADGATAVGSQAWSNTYIWIGKPGNTGVGTAESGNGVSVPILSGVGCDVIWEGFDTTGTPTTNQKYFGTPYDMTGGNGNYVEMYPEWQTKSEVLRICMSNKPTITNANAGQLITTQYS